ncbi:FAD binding domain-containing protein [Paracandidimonas soli]|jgi:carbon-monoxide dehydrogenase medium subunit|uniref:FAD binding domain-containing protein n=1 Tax=Paracandidimonas soli TaxID=1917182 RepID=UPI0033412590
MKIAPLELRRPRSVEEVLGQLGSLGSDGRVLAGGQSLLPMLRYRVLSPHVLVDIGGVDSLRSCALDDGLAIDALVTHCDMERLPAAGNEPSVLALLRRHAAEIAFRPVRARGTVLGSLMHADPKGDWPLVFFALDGEVELQSLRGVRRVSMQELVAGPLETTCAVDEFAVRVRVGREKADPVSWGRSKLSHRAGEYAMCSAVALNYDSGWECWLGAIDDRPLKLARVSEQLSRADAGSQAELRDGLLAPAADELMEAVPDMRRVQALRHAHNLLDAVWMAMDGERRHGNGN